MSHLDWKFCQVFGDTTALEQTQEPDIINAVQFNTNGNFLAAGDRGGRVVIFNRSDRIPRRSRDGTVHPNVEYKFYSEFQSHEPAFDSLRSNEISESINVISFLDDTRDSVNMLTSNDKTIKLWKVQDRPFFTYKNLNRDALSRKTAHDLRVPRSSLSEPAGDNPNTTPTSSPVNVYDKVHAFRIHSVNPLSDQQNFISADELNIYLWNIENTKKANMVCDMKPTDLNDLQEVITCSTVSKVGNSLLAFGTSRGIVNIIDLRCKRGAGCLLDDTSCLNLLQLTHDCGVSVDQYMREYVSSINDLAFCNDNRTIVARSYYHVLAWDVRMPGSGPIMQVPIAPYLAPLTPRLCSKDAVFDRFTLSLNAFQGHLNPSNKRPLGPLGIRYIVTGGYNYTFNIINVENPRAPSGICARASRQAIHMSSRRVQTSSGVESQPAPGIQIPKGKPGSAISAAEFLRDGKPQGTPTATLGEYGGQINGIMAPYRVDLGRKTLFVASHPNDHILAIATTANLFIYGAVEDEEFVEKNMA